MKRQNSERGMTLVETLVALSILAAISLAALSLISQATRFADAEQDRLLAGVLADNMMAEMLAARAEPTEGEEEKEADFAGRKWRYVREVRKAAEGVLYLRIAVRRAADTQVLSETVSLRAAG